MQSSDQERCPVLSELSAAPTSTPRRGRQHGAGSRAREGSSARQRHPGTDSAASSRQPGHLVRPEGNTGDRASCSPARPGPRPDGATRGGSGHAAPSRRAGAGGGGTAARSPHSVGSAPPARPEPPCPGAAHSPRRHVPASRGAPGPSAPSGVAPRVPAPALPVRSARSRSRSRLAAAAALWCPLAAAPRPAPAATGGQRAAGADGRDGADGSARRAAQRRPLSSGAVAPRGPGALRGLCGGLRGDAACRAAPACSGRSQLVLEQRCSVLCRPCPCPRRAQCRQRRASSSAHGVAAPGDGAGVILCSSHSSRGARECKCSSGPCWPWDSVSAAPRCCCLPEAPELCELPLQHIAWTLNHRIIRVGEDL